MSEFEPIRMAVSHGPDLRFNGRVIGDYSTQNRAGTKSRWTELRLWETPRRAWIAEAVGCSSLGGEGEIRDALVIEQLALPDRINAVMEHFQWTTAAKAFARQMGWEVTRVVD